jgi:sortase B
MKQIVKFIIGIMIILFLIYGFQSLSRLEEDVGQSAQEDKKQELFHQNKDVFAWLTVDGTEINYPVAQHPSDDSYYLSHDLDDNETYYGAIFTELVNSKTLEDPVTIIYGHAITDDSMFGSLDYFADEKFFKDHSLIRIETADKQYEYEIMAAHRYTDDHLFHTYALGSKEGLSHYIMTLKDRVMTYGGSYRQLPVDLAEDKFLILSTCDAVTDTQRYIVTACLFSIRERKG